MYLRKILYIYKGSMLYKYVYGTLYSPRVIPEFFIYDLDNFLLIKKIWHDGNSGSEIVI